MMTDPIADMLTRIRNANAMKDETVNIPTSKVKTAMLEVLKKEGFIADFKSTADVKSVTTVTLKYTADNQRVIKGLKRISKPSLHVYSTAENLPRVLNGLGVAIISTSKGIMSDKEARAQKIGGEVLAYVW
jgi:small subunit ribosomal protein S8